jgi:miniconductance mechanosensitive channel
MEYFDNLLNNLFHFLNISAGLILPLKGAVYMIALALLCFVVNWIAKFIIDQIVGKFVRNSKNKWDDVFLEKKVFRRLSHLAPVSIIYWMGPVLMAELPKLTGYTYLATHIYILFMILIIVYALLDAAGAIYETYDISRSRPIKGYLQVTKIITGMITGILVLSVLMDKSPVYFFTGLGALTAILLLIFKDTILGFVAGIQVTTNNLVQIGDWIEMPKYGADGDVIDISLHSVRIQNFDRTITTIPTYSLISDSFKNWRGMVQTGGRRIMRDVTVDINTIKFCDDEMLHRFEKIHLLRDYIQAKRTEIADHNRNLECDHSILVNGRRMTNIGTFRAYIIRYLQSHPKIHKGLISMVRQMPSGEKGVPLQVYAFTNDTNWANYEAIQADIFDHILSVAPYFDLKVFQLPTELKVNFSSIPDPKSVFLT